MTIRGSLYSPYARGGGHDGGQNEVPLFDTDDLPSSFKPSTVRLIDEGANDLFPHLRSNGALRGFSVKYAFLGFGVDYFIMHRIGFFVCHGHDALDLAGPLSAFNQVATAAGHTLYDLHVISQLGGPVIGNAGLPIETRPIGRRTFDTVLFVGGDIDPMQTSENIAAARKLSSRASRVASVCTGAFLLAQTGLLDGLRATTHWRYTALLQSRFPRIRVEGDSIYIADGRIWTSAGIASGIDLALGMIEKDMGAEIARAVSRLLVVPYRRPGGQSQFSAMSQMEPESDRIRIALNFAREHLAEALPVERLADAARLSLRQFGRAFRRETGETPAKAVERLRVEAARLRLQDGSEPIEQVALAVGFTDPERMRRAFVKLHGHPPQSIRRESRLNGGH